MPKDNLAFALDYPTLNEAHPVVRLLADCIGFAKIGLELFTREGPVAVKALQSAGIHVFLDLKLHDIPETVERAVASACALGVRLLTVHTAGGPAMIERAVARCTRENTGTVLVGVTVLTSLDASDLAAIGVTASPTEQVLRLARIGHAAGLTAFVCSAHELRTLRNEFGHATTLITPGIRPSGTTLHDQKRAATPASAIADGADILVVGRPIRDAPKPILVARQLVQEIDAALAQRKKL